jgi:N-acetylmuramoyl-L-alanine amidase
MREIKYIVLHCTDTPIGREVQAEEVDHWHRERGFQMIGYHYLVRLDGTVEHGRPLFMKAAACNKGDCNLKGIHICYVGGRDAQGRTADTRTDAQRFALKFLIAKLKDEFPSAIVSGHRDWDKGKACPCFNANMEYG